MTSRTPQSPTGRIRDVARDVLGYGEFRPGQEAAMRAVVGGRDTLAVLPSGAGKSAIYQVAGELLGGPVVIVSPLIALQRDQVERLDELGGRVGAAAQLNSSLPAGEQREVLDRLGDGTVRYVFLAPEQLAKPEVVDAIRDAGPALFVVDEAHCVSAWGHDFRPDYLRLGAVIGQLGHPTVLALTATAAPPVRAEIVEQLEMRDPEVVVAGFDRPEIRLEVAHHPDAVAKQEAVLDRVLAEVGGGHTPGIVYSATRRGTEEIAAALTERGIRAAAYHAGLRQPEREEAQRAFMASELDAVVATTAFGMGIDKPDTRFVVHAEPADSLDSYYQEIGRCGRDGEPALAVLVYRQEDLGLRRFFAAGAPAEEELQQVAGLVAAAPAAGVTDGVDVPALRAETGRGATPLARDLNLLEEVSAVVLDDEGRAHPAAGAPEPGDAAAAARELAEHHERVDQSRVEMMRGYAETTECRRQFLLGYFGEQLAEPCGNCDNCSAGTSQEQPEQDDVPFPVQTAVRHPEWGAGVVMRIEDDRLVVLFDEVGYKTLGLAAVVEHDLLRGRSITGRLTGERSEQEHEEGPVADIVSVIKEQHRQVDRLLEQAGEMGPETARLIQQVADLLLPHSEAEEDFVYPTIRKKSEEAGDEVKDGVAEHQHIEDMLRTLLSQEPGDPGYDGTLAALTAELRHHVEEEEEDLLPELEQHSSPEELQRMGERFLQATSSGADGGSEDGGSGDGEPTKAELYEKAKEQDVPGRSTMTKDELADAVE